jgi:Flp pilus assembly protein TadB
MASSTPIWPLIFGSGIIIFSILLFILRVNIRIIVIFLIMGISLIVLWLYLDARTKQLKKNFDNTRQICICQICNHEEVKVCLQQKCACCLAMKGNTVIGHSNNPLQ